MSLFQVLPLRQKIEIESSKQCNWIKYYITLQCIPYSILIGTCAFKFDIDQLIAAIGVLIIAFQCDLGSQIRNSDINTISKTIYQQQDSILVQNQVTQFHLLVTQNCQLIAQSDDFKKQFSIDDMLNKIIVKKVAKCTANCPKNYLTFKQVIQSISQQHPKCLILQAYLFENNFMIELQQYQEQYVGITINKIDQLCEYIQKSTTKQLMNQLFRSFSHEFSTSLNCIRILIENACEDIDDDTIVKSYLQPIRNSTHILNSIIQDVRDFSLILQKNFVLTIQIQDVGFLINETADLFREQLSMKGVQLNINVYSTNIHTDGPRVLQILVNLLGNAQKFTNQGIIKVELQELNIEGIRYLKIIVSDTGTGMSKEKQMKLKEFLENPHKPKNDPNFGLGLLISNKIAQGLSQHYKPGIHFSSSGEGSIFWFFLEDLKTCEPPDQISRRTIKYHKLVSSGRSFLEQSFLISPSDKKRQPSFTFSLMNPKIIDKSSLIEKNSENLTFSDDCVGQTQPYIFREDLKKPTKNLTFEQRNINFYPNIDLVESVYGQNTRILIVDDEYINIYALTTMLNRLNLQCDSAHNGLEGVEKFKKYHYSTILMDIEMPILNGIQATQQIFEHCRQADLDPPIIIAQTAYTDMQTKQLCKEVGMDYFLQKPINTNEIKQILQTIL